MARCVHRRHDSLAARQSRPQHFASWTDRREGKLRYTSTHSSFPKRFARSVLERALHQITCGGPHGAEQAPQQCTRKRVGAAVACIKTRFDPCSHGVDTYRHHRSRQCRGPHRWIVQRGADDVKFEVKACRNKGRKQWEVIGLLASARERAAGLAHTGSGCGKHVWPKAVRCTARAVSLHSRHPSMHAAVRLGVVTRGVQHARQEGPTGR